MGKKDPTCPDVKEEMKWRRPAFMCKGVLCGMAALKEHCAFGFWKGPLVVGGGTDADAMGPASPRSG